MENFCRHTQPVDRFSPSAKPDDCCRDAPAAVPLASEIDRQGINQGIKIGREFAFAFEGPQPFEIVSPEVVQHKYAALMAVVLGVEMSLADGFDFIQGVAGSENGRRIHNFSICNRQLSKKCYTTLS